MASSTRCTQFKLMLMRVADLLTEKNVKDLAFLCNDIKPATRATLTNARDLFTELQGHDLLHDGKVNVLVDWLDELRLQEACKHVKEYSERYLECTEQQNERCTEHEDQRLKYFCLTCDRKVCADCSVKSHSSKTTCKVIEITDTDVCNEVSTRLAEKNKLLNDMKAKTENMRKLWIDKKEFLSKCREKVRKEIQADYIALQDKLDKNKLCLMQVLNEKELSDLKILMLQREEIERLSNSLTGFDIDVKLTSSSSLDELKRINASIKQFKDVRDQMEKHEIKVQQKTVDFLYRKVANDGVFGSVVSCSLVGGVELQKRQLLHVYDERQCSEGVRLICIDPKDRSKEYWRHLVPIDDKVSPIVMSYINLYYKNIPHVLFAVGKMVFIIQPHWEGRLHDSVQSVSSRMVDEVEEGSWITSIAVHHPTNEPCDEFLISVSNSSLIREYRITGEALRKIETKDWIPAVRCVAYVKEIFAVNGSGRNDVILLKIDNAGAVTQIGTLRPPSDSAGLLPACLIWPGYTWLILFVSATCDKGWQVAHYQKTGELIKVCAEGASYSDMDVPISISRWENEGFISFADNSVKIFTY